MEEIKTPAGTPLSPPKKIVEDAQAALLSVIASEASNYRIEQNRSQNASVRLHRAVMKARDAGIAESAILSAIAK
jgi:hypothetical protein